VDNCWVWNKSINTHGYGQFGLRKKVVCAHKASLILHKIHIPEGYDVRHKCPKHFRHCVNPAHLTTGTRAENVEDSRQDGTMIVGENSIHAKLTEAQVLEIRASEMSELELANKFNVSKWTIWAIISYKRWKHI
jgi:hypothetical protein